MKIGVDLDATITAYPELFGVFTKAMARPALSVLFSEPGGWNVQDFSVLGDCSPGDCAYSRFDEFVSDFVVVERPGFVLIVDDLLESGLDGIP